LYRNASPGCVRRRCRRVFQVVLHVQQHVAEGLDGHVALRARDLLGGLGPVLLQVDAPGQHAGNDRDAEQHDGGAGDTGP
jgi:hypothetical protein